MDVEFKSLSRSQAHAMRGDWPMAETVQAICCMHNHIHLCLYSPEGRTISELVMSPAEGYALAQELLHAYDLAEDIL